MARRYFWFIAWVALIVILFAVTIFNAWSPFAEGRSGGSGGGVYVRSGGGPNHK
jgi:hypothetical protein